MTQDTSTYYVWIGSSCDYDHKERAGGAAIVIEHNGNIISRDVISLVCIQYIFTTRMPKQLAFWKV